MASPPPLVLWVVLLVLMKPPSALHRCVSDEAQAEVRVVPGVTVALEGYFQVKKPRSILMEIAPPPPPANQPIRIKIWVPEESDGLSEAETGRVEVPLEEAVRVVSSLLSVNRVQGPLRLHRDINRYCKFLWRNSSVINHNRCGRANRKYRAETCLGVTIPDDHLAGCDIYPEAHSTLRTVLRPDGAGLVDTDFLLYLLVQATDKCKAQDLLAYAVHCQTDTQGRPVAGVVIVCKNRLTATTYSHQTAVQTLTHELFHVLGFSKDLFNTWKDCSSSSSQGGAGCSPRRKVTHPDGSGQMRIYTPAVISALQKHLMSSDRDLGGPLENLGVAPGRASSHWESRVLQGSIMAAVLGDPTTVRIDPLTLAAFQDTGWYTVNLSQAQSLVWGQAEGAKFGSLSTCTDQSSLFFCSGSGFGCHFLHLHKGQCETDDYLESCRLYKPVTNGSECFKEENIQWWRSDEKRGEIFGVDSRCFFSSLFRQSQEELVVMSNVSVDGRCYRHRCTGPNKYQIQVSGSGWEDCPAGGSIQIKGYKGLVFCPDSRLCSSSSPSSDSHEAAISVHLLLVSTTVAACLMVGFYWTSRRCKARVRPVSPELHSDL
ncbi:leishmanolysin-like peptidase 2 [Gouania willdenowi]|uniref:leishmanolysin-like peptidase 2 n=1 Tax=Gouania willdenowi TaxID=441366 RepID=UPI0010554CA4|nr:leishmanolysin-like peptidase 2 [Gouania willdenowi]